MEFRQIYPSPGEVEHDPEEIWKTVVTTGRAVMDLMRSLVHRRAMTAVVATHDPVLVGLADAVVDLSDGAVSTATPAGRGPAAAAASEPTRRHGRHSAG